MRALHLYFADTAKPGRGSRPIEPGAFSRWMESRKRAAIEAQDVEGTRRGTSVLTPRFAAPKGAGAG